MRPLLILLLLLATAPALARTIAVLPLQPAAGSEEHAGLGTALAGMLTSDLASLEGLTLVERDRLDDLLGEIALSESGFLDPSTAQRLGEGVGAEWVLLGSWSVVGTTFLMDARVVVVQSGQVLEAADAQGEVADFVTVEKDLVEGLLEELEVEISSSERRKLLGAAPTESFPAFAAFGEGQAQEAAGRIEEARAAYERAATLDPRFEEARRAVAALQLLVEEERARRAAQGADRQSQLRQRVIEAVPDERTRAAGFEDDLESLAHLGLRWLILEELELHCQRHEEMRHYLDRVGWEVARPERAGGRDLYETTMAAAIDLELIEHPGSLRTIPMDRSGVASMPGLFSSLHRFLLDLDEGGPGQGKSRGLTGAIQACRGPADAVDGIWELVDEARRRGLHQSQVSRHEPGVTLDDHLVTLWALLAVRHRGMDPVVEARVTEVLSRHPEGAANTWATMRVDSVAREADGWDRRRALTGGLPIADLEAVVRDAAAGGGDLVSAEGPTCGHAVEIGRAGAENAVKGLDRDRARADPRYLAWTEARLGPPARVLMDLGCVRGVPARTPGAVEVLAMVSAAAERRREDHAEDEACVAAFAQLPSMVDSSRIEGDWVTEEHLARQARAVLTWYYSALVSNRCVEP